jgi:hypothetical protein
MLAKPRVAVVRRTARTARVGRRRCSRFVVAETFGQVALDLSSVTCAGVELPNQPSGTGAQSARHLPPVRLRELPHCAVEFEFLDGSQCQHFLALQRRSRALPDHGRPIFFRRDQRSECTQRCEADERTGPHQDRQQHDGCDALSSRGKERGGCASQAREHKELPRLQTGITPVFGLNRNPTVSSSVGGQYLVSVGWQFAVLRDASIQVAELVVEPLVQFWIRLLWCLSRFGWMMTRPADSSHPDSDGAETTH